MYRILFLLLPLSAFSQPQSFRLGHGCAYDGEQSGNDVYVFDASDEAQRIVAELLDALGLQKNFIVKSSSVQNALATTDRGQRYILYSTSFLEKFKADANTRWAAYSVLAHEIGHHLNAHDFSENDLRKRKLLELEADQFSGSVLRMLGAGLTESQAGIETIGLEGESNTHPAKVARREAVANGWKSRDEWLRDRGMSTQPQPGDAKEPTDNGKLPVQTNPPSTRALTERDYKRCKDCPEMVFVEGGTFTMGCTWEQGDDCLDHQKPAHEVAVPSFFIGKYEVTQAEWESVMGSNPSEFKDCPSCPVENVSWEDVQEFIKNLNAKTGKNFRLPSEAEWEYAARGGSKTKKFKYAGDTKNLGLVAWWYGNSGKKTHPIGERKANELGIKDMSGNVWEWCADTWHYDYTSAPVDGSAWETTKSAKRVLRGGGWHSDLWDCCVAYRVSIESANRNDDVGFRLAL